MRQFLLETALITAAGGAIGFGISFAICLAVPSLGATEFVGDPGISWSVAAMTALVLGATDLAAGYFPAREASRLDPITAMKL
jgi:ABC-type antimicrobial peptide transport system permease subunit